MSDRIDGSSSGRQDKPDVAFGDAAAKANNSAASSPQRRSNGRNQPPPLVFGEIPISASSTAPPAGKPTTKQTSPASAQKAAQVQKAASALIRQSSSPQQKRTPPKASQTSRPQGTAGKAGTTASAGTSRTPGKPSSSSSQQQVKGSAAAQRKTAPAEKPPKKQTQNQNQKQAQVQRQKQERKAVQKKSSPKPRKVSPHMDTFTYPEDEVVGKSRFTKKQAMQITGLILMLILILGLTIVLVLNHYFGLFDRSGTEDITNSSPKLYSDVDPTRDNTIDKAIEDERLMQELTDKSEKITSKEVLNILLVGEDLRDTEEQTAGNTDVMMLISVNKKDNTITLTSIMRDCYVAIETDDGIIYNDRINAAYWYGGMRLTKHTVEDYLNVKIDRYVLVNFKVFIDIVDELGGIDMYVSDEEANGYPGADPYGDNTRGMQNPLDEQNKYLGNKKKTDYIKKGGDLHLNGNQALAYARLRHVGNSDYERTERQRKVIKEMIKKSRKMSLVQMDRLANKVFPQVKTDVTNGELAGLLVEMLEYRSYKVQELRIPADETFTNEIIDGKDVLSVDFYTNQELFKEKAYGTVKIKTKEENTIE